MRRVTIIGSGRTGRGMLGELFYSEKNFDLVFADIDSSWSTRSVNRDTTPLSKRTF